MAVRIFSFNLILHSPWRAYDAATRRAHPAIVAARALLRAGRGQHIAAQGGSRAPDSIFTSSMKSSSTERGLPSLRRARRSPLVGPPSGQLLVAERVDVKLRLGDFLRLRPLARLQIDDRRFAGIERRTRSIRPTTDTPSPRLISIVFSENSILSKSAWLAWR